MKCSITQEECSIDFNYGRDNCPIGRYKDSSFYYGPGESRTGAQGRIDPTCRYYGQHERKNYVEG